MNKAYKYQIYPTKEQQILFAKTFGCCRKVYNLMLADKIACYQKTKSFGNQTPAMYKSAFPFLKEVDSLALANVQLNLNQGMKNHFNKKRKIGFPKFKSAKRSRKSYTTNNQNGTIRFTEQGIRLPKIGIVKAKLHRLPPSDWKLKSATISQERDGSYFISILFEYEDNHSYHPSFDNAIGLDYASDGLYVDSNGKKGSHHKFLRESQEKLAKEQRKLSRMKGFKKGEKPSNNFKKQLKKITKLYRHIANQRKDNLQKLSTEIANQYDVVCVESLNMQSLANKSFGNGKATYDNGYGMFLAMLDYKLKERGKYLIFIDKWFPSSQICHVCGKRHPEMKDLSIRTMNCACGLTISRDQNAAINIKNEGLRLLKEVA